MTHQKIKEIKPPKLWWATIMAVILMVRYYNAF